MSARLLLRTNLTLTPFARHVLRILVVLFMLAPSVLSAHSECFMAAAISVDSADKAIGTRKAEAALNLALSLAGYKYCDLFARDSILKGSSQLSVREAASRVGCTYSVFLRVRRIEHLVRADMQVVSAADTGFIRSGVGYAAIAYTRGDNTVVADPAVLLAVQRAALSALPTEPRYDTLDVGLRARKASVLSFGGITFKADSSYPEWAVFSEQLLASYDVTQAMVAAAQANDTITVLDIDTHDTLFARAGFYLVENNRHASKSELNILYGVGVDYVVLGSVERTLKGAELTLRLARIESNGTYSVIRTTTGVVDSDTKEALRTTAETVLLELLKPA
ncbi:MAG: hypothetical protein UZ06_CHB003001307 [Chlorobi bacterium OLB6]|nr:MAG: hypothetical protein UZ06_CHB003001307 [Chlorobi bacterium OLB6]